MKPLSLALVLFLGVPSLALAEIELPELTRVETAYGVLEVVKTDGEIEGEQLLLNGISVRESYEFGFFVHSVNILHVFPSLPGKAQKVLVSLWNGGNCTVCTRLSVLSLSKDGVAATESFADSAYGLEAISWSIEGDDQVIRLEMASGTSAIERFVFVVKDQNVIEGSILAPEAENPIAAGAGWGRQVLYSIAGEDPATVIESEAERFRFRTILTSAQFDDLLSRMRRDPRKPTYSDGGFVLGESITEGIPKSGDALWGIRIEDGAPFVIFWNAGGKAQRFGLSREKLPFSATEFLDEL